MYDTPNLARRRARIAKLEDELTRYLLKLVNNITRPRLTAVILAVA